jgi:hypothetical protein
VFGLFAARWDRMWWGGPWMATMLIDVQEPG